MGLWYQLKKVLCFCQSKTETTPTYYIEWANKDYVCSHVPDAAAARGLLPPGSAPRAPGASQSEPEQPRTPSQAGASLQPVPVTQQHSSKSWTSLK